MLALWNEEANRGRICHLGRVKFCLPSGKRRQLLAEAAAQRACFPIGLL